MRMFRAPMSRQSIMSQLIPLTYSRVGTRLTGMSKEIEDIALPHLDYMTEQVAKENFKPRGGAVHGIATSGIIKALYAR